MNSIESTTDIRSMELLVSTVQQLSSAHTIEDIMRVIRTVARNITGADGATFVLRDHDLCYYADEDAISPLWKGSRFPMKTCISGWAMLNKKPAVIPDIYLDDRIPIDAYSPTFVKSLVMVPIRQSDPLGAIGCYWAQMHIPTDEEIRLLQGLADITAVSVQHVYDKEKIDTQMKEREQMLVHIEDQKNQLEEFTQIIAHNLRAPLANMQILNTMIKDSTSAEKKLVLIEKQHEIVNILQTTFNNLIDALQVKQDFDVERELIDIEEKVSDTMRMLYPEISKSGAKITYDFREAPAIYFSQKYFDSIMLNLISNSLRYKSPEREPRIHIKSYKTDNCTLIEISDNGLGIDLEKHRKDLFCLHKTFHDHPDAKGFGLFLTKNHIAAMDGEIDVQSQVGKGSKFIIKLPQNIMTSNNKNNN